MKTINKKIIITISIIILLSILIILIIPNKELKENKMINNKINKEMFAIMVYDEVRKDYVPYTKSDTFPLSSDGYTYNGTLSHCVDINGQKIEGTITSNEDNTITIETNKTLYCYIYYDYEKPDDIKVAVTINGEENSSLQYAYYDKELNCTNGTATYNNKYDGISIRSGKVNCTLNYKTPSTSYPILKAKVETTGTSGSGSIVNESADNAGYRYEGKNPNNYVWFNNELWRIIGSVPTKTSRGTVNLVKIIRNQPIGGIAYAAIANNSTGAWGSNTLYTLLNHYYYLPESSSINTSRTKDATDTSYCCSVNTYKAKCNYKKIGIEYNSYYGRMVENVYWNTGASNSYQQYVSQVYGTEKNKQTVQGYIGLMSASDYGYATSASHSVRLDKYNNETHTTGNWLFSQGYEWTSIQLSSYAANVLYVSYSGEVTNIGAGNGFAIRPVLHLNTSVYVISGNGSITNPYIIGMS